MADDPAELLSLVHDLQSFIDLWNRLTDIANITEKALKVEYGVTSLVADEEEYWFQMDGKHYSFYDDELVEEGEPLMDQSTKPWIFLKKQLAIWSTLWNVIEAEYERRGWECSREDYFHILSKGGWSVELSYYPCCFEDGVGDFEYEPDQPGYYWPRPFEEIVDIARYQTRRENGLTPGFKLSDLEAEMDIGV